MGKGWKRYQRRRGDDRTEDRRIGKRKEGII
jgi:hypothetical protein